MIFLELSLKTFRLNVSKLFCRKVQFEKKRRACKTKHEFRKPTLKRCWIQKALTTLGSKGGVETILDSIKQPERHGDAVQRTFEPKVRFIVVLCPRFPRNLP